MHLMTGPTLDFSSRRILVYDIGGTSLRGAVYRTSSGTVDKIIVRETPNRISLPTLSAGQLREELIKTIGAISSEILTPGSASAACVAFPGPIDRQGRIVSAPGIWGSNPSGPLDILAELRDLWPEIPLFICNDLTAAGYRYLENGTDTFCVVTVSTGIGSKVFINGEPQLGPNGIGGEIGHAKVLFSADAPVCDCGERGHLQSISSGRGVQEKIRQKARMHPGQFSSSLLSNNHNHPDTISNHTIVEAFRSHDPFTVEILTECIKPLAAMLVNLHLAIGLERFVVIGGFAQALGEQYRLALAKYADEFCWESRGDWREMIRFGFADDLSGLIGAGRFARLKLLAHDDLKGQS